MKTKIMFTFTCFALASCTPTGAPRHPGLGFEIIDGLLDVVACGSSLLGGGAPTATQAIGASTCFLDRVRDRVKTAGTLELASTDQPHDVMSSPAQALEASEDHGQLVIEAAKAAAQLEQHPCESHRQEALDAVKRCLPPGIDLAGD